MKKRSILALLFIVAIGFGCKKEKRANRLNGVWIEAKDRSDTIVINDEYFSLNRGKEMRNGYLLPKYGSGTYAFKFKQDSISLYNQLSSCYCFFDYFFEQQENSIRVGDFYRKNPVQPEILTFIKEGR